MVSEWKVYWDGEDLQELIISLDALHPPELVGDHLKPLASNIVFATSRYPPELPDQQYQRTERLFQAWDYKQVHPLAVKIENHAEYAGYVQGQDDQAAIHQGRWKVLELMAQKHVMWLLERLSAVAGKIWETGR